MYRVALEYNSDEQKNVLSTETLLELTVDPTDAAVKDLIKFDDFLLVQWDNNTVQVYSLPEGNEYEAKPFSPETPVILTCDNMLNDYIMNISIY
jgi:hypothetical protein